MREQLERFLNENTVKGTLPGKVSIVLLGEQACAAEKEIRQALESTWQGLDAAFFLYQEAFQVSSLTELPLDELREVHRLCAEWTAMEETKLCIVTAADSREASLSLELAQLASWCYMRACYAALDCGVFALVPSEIRNREKAKAVRTFFEKLYAMQDPEVQPAKVLLRYLEDEEPEELNMWLNAKVFLLERKHKFGNGVLEPEPERQMEPLAYLLESMDRCTRACYLPLFEEDDMPDGVKLLALLRKRLEAVMADQPAVEEGSIVEWIEQYVQDGELRRDDFLRWMDKVCVYQADPAGRDRLAVSEKTEREYFGNWMRLRYERWEANAEQQPMMPEALRAMLRDAGGDQLAGYLDELKTYLAAPERNAVPVPGGRMVETDPRNLRRELIGRLYIPRYEACANRRATALAESAARLIQEKIRDGNKTYAAFLQEVDAALQEWRSRVDVNGFINTVPPAGEAWMSGFNAILDGVLAESRPDYRQLFEHMEKDPGMAVRVGGYREWCCRVSGVAGLGGTELADIAWGSRRGQKLKAMLVAHEGDKGSQGTDSTRLDYLTFWRML